MGAEYYEWQINRVPLPEGRDGVVCYFRDISAQVLARAAMAESEEQRRRTAIPPPKGLVEFHGAPARTVAPERLHFRTIRWSKED